MLRFHTENDSDEESLCSSCTSSELESDFSEESDYDEDDMHSVRQWCNVNPCDYPPPPPRFPFTGKPGIRANFRDDNDPLEYFNLFFDEGVIKRIVDETNKYAMQYMSKNEPKKCSRANCWASCDANEIRVFFALLILQGIVKKPKEKWYWARKPVLETPFFVKILSEKRFSLIMKFLHFSDNETFDETTHPYPKLKKIWTILEILVKKFRNVYVPERDISIDESLLLYKGRLSWKQYIPSKSSKFGIKLFMLCEASTGYIWNYVIYTGRGTKFASKYEHLGLATKSVMTLVEDLLGQGYCLTLDNFYTSPELAEILIENKTDMYGTMRINRKYLPEGFKQQKVKKNEILAFQKGKILVMKWVDKKVVGLLSTIHSIEQKEVKSGSSNKVKKKPVAIADYNATMGGIDRADQNLVYYSVARKQQKKYYKKIFRHMLDQCIWNAYVLYRRKGGIEEHLEFRVRLVERLIEEHCPAISTRNSTPRSHSENLLRLVDRHFPSHIPENVLKKEPTRRCVVCCSKRSEKGKRVRKETRYFCEDCNVGLCPAPCFKIYHTKQEF